jgi:hypothetical protein
MDNTPVKHSRSDLEIVDIKRSNRTGNVHASLKSKSTGELLVRATLDYIEEQLMNDVRFTD